MEKKKRNVSVSLKYLKLKLPKRRLKRNMEKLFIIFMIGMMMFGSIALMILGIIAGVNEDTLIGFFGGMSIFVVGFLILLASIRMLDSGLKIVELTQIREDANK